MSEDQSRTRQSVPFNISIAQHREMDNFVYYRFNDKRLKGELDRNQDILIHVEGDIRRFLKDSLDVDGFVIDPSSGTLIFLIEGDVKDEDFIAVPEFPEQDGQKGYIFNREHPFLDTPEYQEMCEKIQAYSDLVYSSKDVALSIVGLEARKYPTLFMALLAVNDDCYLQVTNPLKRSYVLDREWGNYVLSPIRNQTLRAHFHEVVMDLKSGLFSDMTPISEADFKALVQANQEQAQSNDLKQALRQARRQKGNKPA